MRSKHRKGEGVSSSSKKARKEKKARYSRNPQDEWQMHHHTDTSRGSTFVCDFLGCGKQFTTLKKLKDYRHVHARYQCGHPGCSRTFSSKNKRDVHQTKHKIKTHLCMICSKCFASAELLKSHKFRAHSAKDRFKCPICKKGYAFQAQLEEHVGSHTGERPFECKQCGKRFRLSRNLSKHLSRVHENPKKYVCDWPDCGKGFQEEQNLVKHQWTHIGEKPLVCEICGINTNSRSGLYKHMKGHTVCPPKRRTEKPRPKRSHTNTHALNSTSVL